MASDATTIQVRVHELRQLFNSIDPSPFRERDLDPDCEEFIVSWARELPRERALRVEIHVDREQPEPHLLAAIAPAVQSHFSREADLENLKLRRLVRDGRVSLAIGLAALTLCITAATLVPTDALGALGQVLRESLILAAWVVMWHPLELLLYGLWPVVRERRLLERLANANVEVALAAPPPRTLATE